MSIQTTFEDAQAFKFPWQAKKAEPLNRKFVQYIPLTGIERTFSKDEFIVSKTDLKGEITYANEVFLRLADMTEDEAIGAPHSIIRHPDMPRAVFKLLWDTVGSGKEIFAYVVNLSKSGDYYWVHAHVTPSFDNAGNIIGYHSNRRVASKEALDKVKPLYAELRRIESASGDAKKGMADSVAFLLGLLKKEGVSYDEFVFSL